MYVKIYHRIIICISIKIGRCSIIANKITLQQRLKSRITKQFKILGKTQNEKFPIKWHRSLHLKGTVRKPI